MQTTHRPCTSDLFRLLLAVSARSVLATAAALVAWAVLPVALGWHVTTVVSDSMAPAIRTGDVVAAVPTHHTRPAIGRVLLVHDPDRADRLRLHRLERIEDDGALRLRGDANPVADTTPVDPRDVLGSGVLRVPWIGLPGTWVRSGDWPDLALALAVTGIVVAAARSDRRLRAGNPCQACGYPRWTLTDHVSTSRPGWAGGVGSTTGAVALVVLGTVTVFAVVAGASFSGGTTTAARLADSAAFPCFEAPVDDAVLAWDFDERDTRVRDDSGHGHAGTPYGPVEGVGGPCGTNPFVSLTDAPGDPRVVSDLLVLGPSTYSIEAWVRTTRSQGSIVSFGSSRSAVSVRKDRRLYVSSSGTAVFGTSSATFNFTLTSIDRINDGRWHHVVGTFRPGMMALYVDGVLQRSRSDNTAPHEYSGYWRIGRESVGEWPHQSDPVFIGDVDTVRVHDRELDPTTIAAHAARGR